MDFAVAIAELFGLLQRADGFLCVARKVEAGPEHEDHMGHILLIGLHLQRRSKRIGGTAILLPVGKPDSEIGECGGVGLVLKLCLHRLRGCAWRLPKQEPRAQQQERSQQQ